MLSISQLSHIYPNGTRALDAVSLDIPRGMFGRLGPNGAGRSTLMRFLATLQIPSSGSIRFDDIDVLAEPERLRETLGYLPQDFGVYPRVSAYEMLDHLAVLKGITARGRRREVVEARLHQVLPAHGHPRRRPHRGDGRPVGPHRAPARPRLDARRRTGRSRSWT